MTWAAGGVFLGSGGRDGVISDGKGGLIFSGQDRVLPRYCGTVSCYLARRVSAAGTLLWSSGAAVLSSVGSDQSFGDACTDDAGGLIAVWEDYRVSGNNISNIYAQRVAADGTLGGDVVDVLLSLASADASPERVSLRWYTSDRAIPGADVERNADGAGWQVVAHVTPDGSGMLPYDDANVTPGQRYGYRLSIVVDGTAKAMGETWVSVPAGAEFALRTVQPNPSSGDLQVAFALTSNAPATLALLDIAGRRVLEREVGSLGAGAHIVRLAPQGAALHPGVYALRLHSGTRSATLRAVVIR